MFNFSDTVQEEYSFRIEDTEKLELLLASDRTIYGGERWQEEWTLLPEEDKFEITLSPFSAYYFKIL